MKKLSQKTVWVSVVCGAVVVAGIALGSVWSHQGATAASNWSLVRAKGAKTLAAGTASRSAADNAGASNHPIGLNFGDLPTMTVLSAQEAANPAIQLPPVAATGEAIAAYAIPTRPDDSNPSSAASDPKSMGIGVVYADGTQLSALPADPSQPPEDYRTEAATPISSTRFRFADNRAHVSEVQVVNGRDTRVQEAGQQFARSASSQDPGVWVPSSVAWTENGISYIIMSRTLPAAQLVAIAKTIK